MKKEYSERLKKLFAEAALARRRVSQYSDEKRAALEAGAMGVIRGASREKAVCRG